MSGNAYDYDMLERITNALRSGSELTAKNRCEFADFLKQLTTELHKKDRTGEGLTGKSDILSLFHWLSINRRDVDVIVVDNDTAEWSTPAICPLTDEDKKNGIQYEPRENWLLTLPVDHVRHEDYGDTVVLNAPLSYGQMCFLFDYMPEETISAKEQELLSRASHTDADFSQRLAYLQTGTAFETRFDGNCMDVEDGQDRLLLCSFLADHSNVYISSFLDNPEVFYPYALERDKSEQLHIVDMPDLCTIKKTEPGEGLLSTLDGRVYYAEHAARAAREGILQSDLDLSSGQERS